jgi:carboxylate-amine ligase
MRFARSEPFSLGVEEELLLADPRDGSLLNASRQVLDNLPAVERGEVKPEVHACQVELITDVCVNAADAVDALAGMRRAVIETGVGLIGSGTHPTAAEGAAEITDTERYNKIRDLLGDAGATPVSAIHIHVGMPDADTAIRVFNGLRRHLPPIATTATPTSPRRARSPCAPGRGRPPRARCATGRTSWSPPPA